MVEGGSASTDDSTEVQLAPTLWAIKVELEEPGGPKA